MDVNQLNVVRTVNMMLLYWLAIVFWC